ncbi:MAG: hypothetical protein JOY89_13945 [Solirubrobacterales bacterium]|nr:hypothetical protein [Solirubrobacterales bacterium]
MVPTASTLLSAWEAGAAEAPLDRAPSLLRSLGEIPPDQNLGAMTVGQCEARLFELRRALFGDLLEAVATCPTCGADVELNLSLAELGPPLAEHASAAITLRQSNHAVAFRVPCNDDLRRLGAAEPEQAIGELVERCLIEARTADGHPVAAAQLPLELQQAILEAMAAADPGAQTLLEVTCPCGAAWVDELDIRSVVWTDLTDWVGRTLTEVHQLARAYGWAEAEILGMGAWRRRWYLEALGW